MTAAALRPMLPGDVPALAAIFRDAVAVLAEEDYSEDQRDAWAARTDDEAAFGRHLAGQLTLVATIGGTPAGFASLEGAERITMLYVDPRHARQRIASLLIDALTRLAVGRGATKLTVDASDAARDFFAVRGFVPMVRNMVPVEDQWLGNTTMTRALAQPDQGSE